MTDSPKQDQIPGRDRRLDGLIPLEQFLAIMGISIEDFHNRTVSQEKIRELLSLYRTLQYLTQFAFYTRDDVPEFYRQVLVSSENPHTGIMYPMHMAWRRANYPDAKPEKLSDRASKIVRDSLENSMIDAVYSALGTGDNLLALQVVDTFLEDCYRNSRIHDNTTYALLLNMIIKIHDIEIQRESSYERKALARNLRAVVTNKFRAAYSPKFLKAILQELGVPLHREQ